MSGLIWFGLGVLALPAVAASYALTLLVFRLALAATEKVGRQGIIRFSRNVPYWNDRREDQDCAVLLSRVVSVSPWESRGTEGQTLTTNRPPETDEENADG